MKKFNYIKENISQLEYIKCDSCEKVYQEGVDVFEIQEFLSWSMVGGYNSVFGDGNQVSLDLCQHCVKEILGCFIKNDIKDLDIS
jgi:hypothetical protein